MTNKRSAICYWILILLCFLCATLARAAGDDLIIASFEANAYGDGWTTTGNAFGSGPARGTLAGQQRVDGFVGKALANSFLGGDDSIGTLTSPPFVVERDFINFLIGGGDHPAETCINLLIDDKVVRTATGTANEHLD